MQKLDESVYALGRAAYIKKSAIFGAVMVLPWAIFFSIFMQKSDSNPTMSYTQLLITSLVIAAIMFPSGFAFAGWIKWRIYERSRAKR